MRQTTRWAPVFACGILLSGCGEKAPESGGAAQVPEWRLNDSPAVDIGVAEGDEDYELAGASSSLRLADGRIVIANSGTSQLRIFDSTGTFVESVGRKGEGPGEFTGSLHLARVSDSEFAVFDQNAQRLSLFDTAGSLVRETRIMAEGKNDFPLWVWLHRNAWVSGPVDTTLRTMVGQALDDLPPHPAGSYLFVVIASDGRIWLQVRAPTEESPHPWVILDSNGSPLGRIFLPAGTEVHQIGADFVLLRHWGENDVEQVQLYRFVERRVPNMASSAPFADHTADSGMRAMMAAAMGNLVMAQEMFYADSAEYARAAGGLNWEGPPGTSLHLMAADKRGWVGLLVHQTQPLLCGMAVGGSTPPGWMEGSPKCSR